MRSARQGCYESEGEWNYRNASRRLQDGGPVEIWGTKRCGLFERLDEQSSGRHLVVLQRSPSDRPDTRSLGSKEGHSRQLQPAAAKIVGRCPGRTGCPRRVLVILDLVEIGSAKELEGFKPHDFTWPPQ